ncbi:MAG: NAD(+) synthase [Nocardioidaceae bacterium]
MLVVINGSPYEAAKDDVRLELCASRAREGECALAYVNLVGGQDELVFDGDSLVVDARGEVVARAAQFEPELLVVDLDLPAATTPMPDPDARFAGLDVVRTVLSSEPVPAYQPLEPQRCPRLDDLAEIYAALGHRPARLRDQERLHLGTARRRPAASTRPSWRRSPLTRSARARSTGSPTPATGRPSTPGRDAAELAERTGLHLETVPIAPMFEAFTKAVPVDGLAEENLQARIRAVVWMALSNQHGHLVLACGNKSELATGYSTIYGDAVGGYAPIKDVPKTLVWRLARWRNAEAERRGETPPIPEGVIVKPPSAELRPGQLDSDSLPEYDLLDAVLDAYVERDLGSRDVIAEGFDPELVQRVITLVDRAEYKRRQYPRDPRSPRATSAGTAGCPSPTAGAKPYDPPAAGSGPSIRRFWPSPGIVRSATTAGTRSPAVAG